MLLFARVGLTLVSFGTAGSASARVIAALSGGTPLSVPHPVVTAFIACVAIAEPLFLRMDDLHARSRGSWSRSWWLYWIGAIGWTLYVILAG